MITAFVDVDTQLDFVCAAGALYTSGAEELADAFAALTKYASANTIRLFSTTDAHAEDDPEFETWKPHCVAGTFGQQKLAATLLEKHYLLQSAPGSLNEPRQLPHNKSSSKNSTWIVLQTLTCCRCSEFLRRSAMSSMAW